MPGTTKQWRVTYRFKSPSGWLSRSHTHQTEQAARRDAEHRKMRPDHYACVEIVPFSQRVPA